MFLVCQEVQVLLLLQETLVVLCHQVYQADLQVQWVLVYLLLLLDLAIPSDWTSSYYKGPFEKYIGKGSFSWKPFENLFFLNHH